MPKANPATFRFYIFQRKGGSEAWYVSEDRFLKSKDDAISHNDSPTATVVRTKLPKAVASEMERLCKGISPDADINIALEWDPENYVITGVYYNTELRLNMLSTARAQKIYMLCSDGIKNNARSSFAFQQSLEGGFYILKKSATRAVPSYWHRVELARNCLGNPYYTLVEPSIDQLYVPALVQQGVRFNPEAAVFRYTKATGRSGAFVDILEGGIRKLCTGGLTVHIGRQVLGQVKYVEVEGRMLAKHFPAAVATSPVSRAHGNRLRHKPAPAAVHPETDTGEPVVRVVPNGPAKVW
jgi:hypothetical protein